MADRNVKKGSSLLRPVFYEPEVIGGKENGSEASDHFGHAVDLISVFHSAALTAENRVRK